MGRGHHRNTNTSGSDTFAAFSQAYTYEFLYCVNTLLIDG